MKVLIVGFNVENFEAAFRDRGHHVVTLEPLFSVVHPHDNYAYQVRTAHLLIAFPPCKYLCSSGLHWNQRRPERAAMTTTSLDFVRLLLDAPTPHICLENPVGCISSQVRPPDQIIQPHQYGHDASKKWCLWLKNLPALVPTEHVAPRVVDGKPRWANQFDSGQNNQINAPDRSLARAERYAGIARAMVAQWGRQ